MEYSWIGPLLQLALSSGGEAASAADRQKQLEVLKEAQKYFGDIGIPQLAQIIAQQVPASSLSYYTPDANVVGNENDALNQLAELTRSGGLGIEDKAALAQIGQQIAQQQRSAAAGLHRSLAARGAMGSGEDYAAQAQLAQNASQQANLAGMNQSAQALRRRMQAISNQGQLAQAMRAQGFQEAQGKASAQDAINRYNAEARNAAALQNNQNALSEFNAQISRAQGMMGPAQGLSNAYGQQAAGQQQFYAGIGQAASAAARPTYQGYGAQGLSDAELNSRLSTLFDEYARRNGRGGSSGMGDFGGGVTSGAGLGGTDSDTSAYS